MAIELVVGKPYEVQKDGYYIEIQYMHGDADGGQEEIAGPFFEKDFDMAEEFIAFLDAVIKGRPGHRYDCDSQRRRYTDHYPAGWRRFTDDDYLYEQCESCEHWTCDKCDLPGANLKIEWPNDPTCDYQVPASMESYEIYKMMHGRKFRVELKKI